MFLTFCLFTVSGGDTGALQFDQMKLYHLQLLLLLLALAILAGSSVEGKSTRSKFVIVGAGMAGITAAHTLSKAGETDFVILEARDKIGGRMETVDFGGYTIERGANWIQGTEGNPIWDLKNEANLECSFPDWESIITYDENGVEQDYYASDYYDLVRWLDFEEAYDCAVDSATKAREEDSADFSQRDGLTNCGWTPSTPLDFAVEFYSNEFEWAEPEETTSAKNTWPPASYSAFKDQDCLVTDPEGYVKLVHFLKDEFLSDNDQRLKLSHQVETVKYHKDGVTVITTSGEKFKADYALVTVSIGVLKNAILPNKLERVLHFEPELPNWKKDLINQFSMAIYEKVYLQFPTRFWPNYAQLFVRANDVDGRYVVWLNYNNKVAKKGSNTLVAFLVADEAARVEAMTDAEIVDDVMPILRDTFGFGIPDPIAVYANRWGTDKLFFGSYSNWPVGVTKETYNDLEAPIHNRLFFGGEAMHDTFNGYVHGAYLNGVDEGNHMLRVKGWNEGEFPRLDGSESDLVPGGASYFGTINEGERQEENVAVHFPQFALDFTGAYDELDLILQVQSYSYPLTRQLDPNFDVPDGYALNSAVNSFRLSVFDADGPDSASVQPRGTFTISWDGSYSDVLFWLELDVATFEEVWRQVSETCGSSQRKAGGRITVEACVTGVQYALFTDLNATPPSPTSSPMTSSTGVLEQTASPTHVSPAVLQQPNIFAVLVVLLVSLVCSP